MAGQLDSNEADETESREKKKRAKEKVGIGANVNTFGCCLPSHQPLSASSEHSEMADLRSKINLGE